MRRAGVVVVMAALVAVPACGGDDGAERTLRTMTSDPTTTSSSSTTTTTTTAAGPDDTSPPTSTTSKTTSTSTSTSSSPPTTTPSGTWRDLPPAPGRASGAPVWTGSELVSWSGSGGDGRPVRGGVAYDLASNAWRELPHGPLEARSGHSAVWTGSEVIVWGGNAPGRDAPFADGAAYLPSSDTWRALPAAPIGGRLYHHALWTGSEMIVWGGSTRCCPIDSVIHDAAAAAYSPSSNSWRPLPDVPAPWSGDGGPAVVAPFGGDMVVWRAGRLGRMDGATGGWQDLGSRPPRTSACRVTSGPRGTGALVGSRLYVWIGHCSLEDGSVYDFDAADWSEGAPPPSGLHSVHAAGARIYGRIGVAGDGTKAPSLVELDTATSRWLAPSDVPGSVPWFSAVNWSGSELLFWGGSGEQHRGGAAYRP